MTDYQSLEVTIENKIAHIRLNQPDTYNTFTPALWVELPKAVKTISDEAQARVIVLSSTGKHFCAGMDLAVFTSGVIDVDFELARKHENLRRLVLQLQQCFNELEESRVPVLVATQGGCIGAGLDMICAADSRYCTKDAFFSIEESKLGMTADVGTLQRLPKLIPQGIVRELAFTGRRFMADEALEAGLVNKVFDTQEAMLDYVMGVAQQIATNSPMAITGCKAMLNYSRDHSVADSLSYMATWQSGMYQPQNDMFESFAAKAEKRAPNFQEIPPVVELETLFTSSKEK
ncbi:MAG: crotonase/enoyl-CoA hydratase family protein [Candidatus Pelagadaptatus aseana]|uniref:crotonase/enoyl-CoA hydratase family protein n=1 Tax=Candidatus Pelagadaptatus aseana TaxID=3120508 RepID=UPI0039B2675F